MILGHHDRVGLTTHEDMFWQMAVRELDATECPDCDLTPRGKGKKYCDAHRCQGTKAQGGRCQLPAQEGLTYCGHHHCRYTEQAPLPPGATTEYDRPPGVPCLNVGLRQQYCADHQGHSWEEQALQRERERQDAAWPHGDL
jgi:hypothetical protein